MQNETDIEIFQQLMQSNPELRIYYNALVEGYEQKIDTLNLNLHNLQAQIDEIYLNNSKFIHELRNNTTIVKSTAQLFESRNNDVKDMNYWNKVVDSINIYEAYLDDYSIYNRSNRITLQVESLEDFISNEIESHYPLSQQTQVGISFTITNEAKSYFSKYSFDPNKLKHVVQNILRNAFDACKPLDKILVNCCNDSSNLIIEISNNGSMIPSDEIDTIFDPYITYKSDGCGLGLVIANSIIHAHNGSISVKSTMDLTVFTITLPIIK